MDDDEVFRCALADALRLEGIRVVEAENGKGALAALERTTHGRAPEPNLLVLDLMMPVMSGIELLQRLRRLDRWSTLPALVATGMNDPMLQALLNVPMILKTDVHRLLEAIRQHIEDPRIPRIVAVAP